LKSLVDAERAFARTAVDKGLRAAFLENLAEDAIVFRPQPAPGRPLYEKVSPDSPTRLIWKPVFAEISGAGDLGYTTGPYEVYKDRLTKEASDFGHYITIWKKQIDGAWKAALDIGISHADFGPSGDEVQSPAEGVSPGGRALSASDIEKEIQALLAREAELSKMCQAGESAKAYRAMAEARLRLYREGNFPEIDLNGSLKLLSRVESPNSWTPAAAGVAVSGDLGYTYGTGQLSYYAAGDSADKVERSFSYMHLWRKGKEGRWRLVLDVAPPYPQK
jgi:ketosteroid isomerase-like protein